MLQVFEEARVSAPPPDVWSVRVVIDEKPSSRAMPDLDKRRDFAKLKGEVPGYTLLE